MEALSKYDARSIAESVYPSLEGQTAEEVKNYGLDVLRRLREALVYSDIADFIAALETRS